MTPHEDLAAVRDATRRLLAHLDGLDERVLRGPSLLPGWTRAHVAAHLAGNAESHVRLLAGCLAGEVREQYAGGAEARAEAIDALATDPARAVRRHREACAALERCWSAMTDEHWTRGVHWLDDAAPSPAAGEPASRRREVEVHGLDLGTGLGLSDAFAPLLLEELAGRTDLPPLVLETPDGRRRGTDGPVVHGTADALARWLSGRSSGDGLTRAGGAPLPELPPWR